MNSLFLIGIIIGLACGIFLSIYMLIAITALVIIVAYTSTHIGAIIILMPGWIAVVVMWPLALLLRLSAVSSASSSAAHGIWFFIKNYILR